MMMRRKRCYISLSLFLFFVVVVNVAPRTAAAVFVVVAATDVDTHTGKAVDDDDRSSKDQEDGYNDDDDDNNIEIGSSSSSECQVYLAISSTSEDHLGMYAGVDIAKGEIVSSTPELGIPLVDFWVHAENIFGMQQQQEEQQQQYYDERAFDSFWTSDELISQFEDDAGKENGVAIVSGLGVCGTHHPGIVNCKWDRLSALERFSPPRVGKTGGGRRLGLLDRRVDPGAGAITEYFNLSPRATEFIHAGTELFPDFGDEWVEITEMEEISSSSSSSSSSMLRRANYAKADQILRNFTEFIFQYPEFFDTKETKQDLWDIIRTDVVSNNITKLILPKDVNEVERISKIGTGVENNPGAMRSLDWLKENGQCMDGLVPGPSTIPSAGRGAFATKFIPNGGLISPAPLLRFHRDFLIIHDKKKNTEQEARHDYGTNEENLSVGTTATRVLNEKKVMDNKNQLLLNYCFGHKDSSLLLFPYGTGVNLINHGEKEKVNAKIQWSSSKSMHRGDMLKVSLFELESKPWEKLILDIVATRDIQKGEEVFIDYGKEWEDAWTQHVENWSPPPDSSEGRNGNNNNNPSSAWILNEEGGSIRTIEEQKDNPYPQNVQIVCSLNEFDKSDESSQEKKSQPQQDETTTTTPQKKPVDEEDESSQVLLSDFFEGDDSYILEWKNEEEPPTMEYQCEILARMDQEEEEKVLSNGSENDSKSEERYIVRVVIKTNGKNNNNPYIVKNIPRRRIQFVDNAYTSAMHDNHAFRHYIGIPDDIFPIYWMDRKGL